MAASSSGRGWEATITVIRSHARIRSTFGICLNISWCTMAILIVILLMYHGVIDKPGK
jgi:hypothetical protein